MRHPGTWLFGLLVLLIPDASQTAQRTCNEWNAVYVSQPDEDGMRVFAAFGKAQGSEPMPFTLTGVDRAGTRVWHYKSVAWCFLGSGGCHMGMRMESESMEAASERPQRIIFVRSSKADTKSTPDILVISGLAAAFRDDARATGTQSLAVGRSEGAPETVIPPDVFYFERCRAD